MRYGLSLLVCIALTACASAQSTCNGPSCNQAVHTAVAVATAPVRVVQAVACQGQVRQVRPIRQNNRRCR
jgi:hypothetical protein